MTLRYAALTTLLLTLPATGQTATSPWFGSWSLALSDPGEKPETLIYSDAGGGAMRMESVEDGSVVVTRFDGALAAATGGRPGPPRTLAITAISPTRYTWTFSIAGKPIAHGVNTLAADGKSFREESRSAAAPFKKVTLVYRRR